MELKDKEQMVNIEMTINGKKIKRQVPTTLRLLDFIRDELRLTGAKEVCSQGECGACTVILDGETVNSCLILAVEANGGEITTVEGLVLDGVPDPLQSAFVEHHSVQCGYCIPGMILSGKQVLADHPAPTREEVKEGLAGNICRCTGYTKIIDAVEAVGRRATTSEQSEEGK